MTEDFEAHLRRTSGSELTVRAYVADTVEFTRHLNGQPPTVEAVESWVSSLLGRGLRPQSVARKLAAVKRFLAWQGRRDLIARETAQVLRAGYRVAPPVRERDKKAPRVVQESEVALLIRNAPDDRWRAFLALLWGTGARVSEILGRPSADIPPMTGLEGKRLARGAIVEKPGKGGRRRRLVLPPPLRPIVGAWAELVPDDVSLFPMTPAAARRGLAKLSASAGIKKVNPHAFRHGAKSRLEAREVPREVIKTLLGHGPSDVTDAYGSVSDERLLAIVAGGVTGDDANGEPLPHIL